MQKGKLEASAEKATLDRLTASSDIGAACSDASVVIEAVPEDMTLKTTLFRDVIAVAPADALLGSNTSSLSITELGAKIGAAERTIGLHFFNPPPVIELLEVVRGLGTAQATVDRALVLAQRLDKTPIVVADAPGFASSRLGVILGAEAIRMLETGVASAPDIDRRWSSATGTRWARSS